MVSGHFAQRLAAIGFLFAIVGCNDSAKEPAVASLPQALGASSSAVDAGSDASDAGEAGTKRAARPAYLLNTMRSTLEQTAAVIEGTVASIDYSFDATNGPRTNVVLTGVITDVGPPAAIPNTVTLRVFGGPIPSGDTIVTSELPRFAVGLKYLVFLANHDWFFSPVVRDLALRIESVNGKDFMLSQEGFAVVGFNDLDLLRGDTRIAKPIGTEASSILAPTGLTNLASPDLAKAVTPQALAASVKAYHPAGMLNTAFDGSFLDKPEPSLTAGGWNHIPATTANKPASASDGGVDAGGGK